MKKRVLTACCCLLAILSFSQVKPTLTELHWLLGTWACETQPGLYEEWKLERNYMSGKGFELANKQEKITERLRLYVSGATIFYGAQPLQNRKEVLFKLTATGRKFIFSNPRNDFPQIIVYEKLKQGRMKITLSDFSANPREVTLFFKRVKSKSWVFY